MFRKAMMRHEGCSASSRSVSGVPTEPWWIGELERHYKWCLASLLLWPDPCVSGSLSMPNAARQAGKDLHWKIAWGALVLQTQSSHRSARDALREGRRCCFADPAEVAAAQYVKAGLAELMWSCVALVWGTCWGVIRGTISLTLAQISRMEMFTFLIFAEVLLSEFIHALGSRLGEMSPSPGEI